MDRMTTALDSGTGHLNHPVPYVPTNRPGKTDPGNEPKGPKVMAERPAPATAAAEVSKEKNAKLKNLELTMAAIDKQYGKNTIMRLEEGAPIAAIPAVSTGSISLDAAIGIGGLPKGRIVEIYGPESSGKTTLALHVIAESQKHGGICAFIDAEHALDMGYARKLGVKTDELLISQPDHGEAALDIVDMLVKSGSIDVLVIDSVAALTPKAELEGEMGDSHVGLQARLMSQAMRKLTATISRSNTCVIFLNQLRLKIGVMFGNPETTTGGNALKFYASVRLDIRRIATLKTGETAIGGRARVKVVKNKVAPPFKECEFDILYGEGISYVGDLIDKAVELELLDKSGAWYSFQGERIGQGRENAREFLKEHPAMTESLDRITREKLGLPVRAPLEPEPKGKA
jgi:recombination protein RecA